MSVNVVNYMSILLLIHNLAIKMLGILLNNWRILGILPGRPFSLRRLAVFLIHNKLNK
jgi:hypothetical protein